MIELNKSAVFTFTFFLYSMAVAAENIYKSEIPIVEGQPMGFGGTPSRWAGFIQVCNPPLKEEIAKESIIEALASLSVGLKSGDVYEDILKPDTEWQTNYSIVGKNVIDDYSLRSGMGPLPRFYQYIIRYTVNYRFNSTKLTLSSVPELLIGQNLKTAAPFTGSYNGEYFHKLLVERVGKTISEHSCAS